MRKPLKPTILGIAIALALLLPSLAPAWSLTHMQGGVQVGLPNATVASDTTVNLTGVATVTRRIPLGELRNGDYFALSAVSVSTGAYWTTMTGASNTAVVACAAVAGVTLTAKMTIPENYLSSGTWEILGHYSANTTTANWITVTASVYDQPATGLTVTTGTIGTGVSPPTTSGQVPAWLKTTNAATYAPNDDVTIKFKVDSGSDATRYEILGVRFRYKPWGVM